MPFISIALFASSVMCFGLGSNHSRGNGLMQNNCTLFKCNSTDPNCDTSSWQCKTGYRMCCDRKCRDERQSCVVPIPYGFSEQPSVRTKNVTCHPKELCFRNKCLPNYSMCRSGECVHEPRLCGSRRNCSGGSDEEECLGRCYPSFRCQNNSCKKEFFNCDDGKCILQEEVCNCENNCVGGTDELNCSSKCYPKKACNPDDTCKSGYFRCDKAKCIPNLKLCDQRADCRDGADEIRTGFGFKCTFGSNFRTCLLAQEHLNNGEPKCVDRSDACDANGTNRCFTCLDRKLVISEMQWCDGIVDCQDLSDECLCGESNAEQLCQSICLNVNSNASKLDSPSDDIQRYLPTKCNCSSGELDCGNGICLNQSRICDGVRDCGETDLDEKFCESTTINEERIICPGDAFNTSRLEAVMCDGRPECHDLSDECNQMCNSTPRFCSIKSSFKSKNGPFEFLCNKKSFYFDVKAVCDGKWSSCSPRIKEEELDCPSRYYCKSGESISIDKSMLCDGMPHCDDHSDEKDCKERFYCEGGVPFSIPLFRKLDGIKDCDDYSDECPKDVYADSLASQREMLGGGGFRILIWIIGTAAILGNGITFAGISQTLVQGKTTNRISKITYAFLLNLSVADCLMGFYLIALSIESLRVSGKYCMHDKAWRTSTTCAVLGSLALLSSQASVFILVCLTTLRLYAVLNPTTVNNGSATLYPSLAMVVSWITPALMAFLPNCPSFSNYFTSEIWMQTNLTNLVHINKSSLMIFSHRLATFRPAMESLPADSGWYELIAFLRRNYAKELQIKGQFGYFSDNSVCLPKLFLSFGETGWEYTLAVVLINFSAFCYIAGAYWIVFRVSCTEQAKRLRSKQLVKMQKHVARLVITDFFCWVPICVSAFVQLGGVPLSNMAYEHCAVAFLPINSAINPFLYSNTLIRPIKKLFRTLRKK